MQDLISKCENVLAEISKFSEELLLLGPAINDRRLEIFQSNVGISLPFDFLYLMRHHNGFSLAGTEVYGIGEEFKGSSLDNVYEFEHENVQNKMPKQFVPFSPDGRGNHYCLDLGRLKDNLCPVVFWQSSFVYPDISDVETCNDSFISWIEEVMIEWTLDDYNYDGSQKINDN